MADNDYWKKKYADYHSRSESRIAELKAENERLKEEKGGMQILIDNYIALTEKYHKTLQEIKAIAEKNKDTSQYGGICKSILNLITKAEEE